MVRFRNGEASFCGEVALWCVMTAIAPAHKSRLFCIPAFFFQLPDKIFVTHKVHV